MGVPNRELYTGNEEYNAAMQEYQRERAALGLEFEPYDLPVNRNATNVRREQEEAYNQMLSEAEALRAQTPSTINEMGFDTSSPEWEAGLARWAEANPEEWNKRLIENAAQAQADANLEGQQPIAPINPNQPGRAILADERERERTIEENEELALENEGYLGNNLQQEPTVFATQAQLDEIRGLEKKISDDTGGSLQYGDYGRMSTSEAQDILDGLKAEVNWDDNTGAPESGLYNPVPGPQDNLLGPDGVEYELPERPGPTFPGTQPAPVSPINEMGFDTSSPEWAAGLERYAAANPEEYAQMLRDSQAAAPPTSTYPGAYDGTQTGSGGQQSNQATALRQVAPLDFSRGNPFQGAAYDAGFQDFNTIDAQQQSLYNNAAPADRAQMDQVRDVIGGGNLSGAQQGMIAASLRDQQATLDQRQAGWDARAASQPGKANTTGGTALMPTYTGVQ